MPVVPTEPVYLDHVLDSSFEKDKRDVNNTIIPSSPPSDLMLGEEGEHGTGNVVAPMESSATINAGEGIEAKGENEDKKKGKKKKGKKKKGKKKRDSNLYKNIAKNSVLEIVNDWEPTSRRDGKENMEKENLKSLIVDKRKASDSSLRSEQQLLIDLPSAVVKRDIQSVVKALERGEDPNGTLSLGDGSHSAVTYLHYASWSGYESIVRALVMKGVDVNCVTRESGYTPLHFAVLGGRKDIVAFLLQSGAEVDVKGYKNQETPMTIAVSLHGPDMVDLFMEHGKEKPDLKQSDARGFPLLQLSYISHGYKLDTLTRHFLGYKGIYINQESHFGHTLLDHATRYGDISGMRELIENGAATGNSEKDNLLCLAATTYNDNMSKNCLEAFRIVIEAGADLYFEEPSQGRNALHLLAGIRINPDVDMSAKDKVKFEILLNCLLKNGISIDATTKYGETPLSIAMKARNVHLVKSLLSKGASREDINDKGESCLHVATRSGLLEIVDLLLNEYHMDVNSVDNGVAGCTSLIWACGYGYLDIVNLLIQNGALFHKGCKNSNFTPLHAAAREGKEEILSILLQIARRESQPVKRGWFSRSRENKASKQGEQGNRLKRFDRFLHGKETVQGFTPLHYAAQKNHVGIIEQLVAYGVRVNEVDFDDQTPKDVADRFGSRGASATLTHNGGTNKYPPTPEIAIQPTPTEVIHTLM